MRETGEDLHGTLVPLSPAQAAVDEADLQRGLGRVC